jgi:hypothetical protein
MKVIPGGSFRRRENGILKKRSSCTTSLGERNGKETLPVAN